MIYSQWQPDRGGYAYYETSERLGLADDLPTPTLRPSSDIGVASTSSGRRLPLGAKLIGYGSLARGSIVPFDRGGLSGISFDSGTLKLSVLAAVAAVAGFFVTRKVRR